MSETPTLPERRPCKLCGKEIVFFRTRNGHPFPCDGRATTVFALGDRGPVQMLAHLPHFVTCPKWKKGEKP